MKKSNFKLELLFCLLLFPAFMMAQVDLSGVVTNERGSTVPFANVVEKGTNNGTTTDIDGNFSIEVSSIPVTLVFSSLGYEDVETRVTNASSIAVTLVESAQALEEVVITGLATSVKRTNSSLNNVMYFYWTL